MLGFEWEEIICDTIRNLELNLEPEGSECTEEI